MKIILNASRTAINQLITQRSFSEDIGHSSVVEKKKKWYGTCPVKPDEKWDQQAKQMIELFAQCGHLVFRGISALTRGILKRKSGRNTIHVSTDSANIQLIMHVSDAHRAGAKRLQNKTSNSQIRSVFTEQY